MLYDDYAKTSRDYRKKYGVKAIVLIEVGSFYELYAVADPSDMELGETDLRDACQILDIQVTKKNKSNPDSGPGNPFMAGFPSFMIDKYTEILVSSGYTVILMEQQRSKVKSKTPTFFRSVSQVISPGTFIPSGESDSCSHGCGRFTVVLVLSSGKVKSRDVISYGLACADFSTGEVCVYEPRYHTLVDVDPKIIKEDLFRMVSVYKPIELIVMGSLGSREDIQDIMESIDVGQVASVVHDKTGDQYQKEYSTFSRIEYQNVMLQKVWPCKMKDVKHLLSPIEVLDLERMPLASSALCALLQFAYEHGETTCKALLPPKFTYNPDSKIVSCNHNSVMQLNIIPSMLGKERCFLATFNKCVTSMGRRLFRSRLLTPIYDIDELNERYNKIEKFLDDNDYAQKQLRGVVDLPRFVRKLASKTIDLAGVWCLVKSLETSLSVIGAMSWQLDQPHVDAVKVFIDNVYESFEDAPCTSSTSWVKPGVSKGVDENVLQINLNQAAISSYIQMLNGKYAQGQEFYKQDYNERDGYYISVTKKRHKDIVDKHPGVADEKLITLGGSQSASNATMRLSHAIITVANRVIVENKATLSELNKALFTDMMDKLFDSSATGILALADAIAEIDLYSMNAGLCRKFGWSRPELASDRKKAYVKAQNVRHPIIECILQDHEYVPNDVHIGLDGCDGILLYGINSSGKSSYMKAIGLCSIMAQSGMFVPASSWRMQPFKNIFTRITSTDNIYAGKSTFTNEIIELRNILKCVDENSLVIGDELCSGTESISAVSIVGAGIERLAEVGCSFVFATHLHELSKMGIIRHLETVKICHLYVQYDPVKGSMVYDRRIRDGPGEALYGLEVCKSLDLDSDFIRCAVSIRKKVLGQIQELVCTKTSRYNARVYMDLCDTCGDEMSTETHHIIPQRLAEEGTGLVMGRFHKNKKFNLKPICERCHLKLHHDELKCTSTQGI